MRIRLLFSDDNRHEREATRQRRGNANACSGPEAAKAAKGAWDLYAYASQ